MASQLYTNNVTLTDAAEFNRFDSAAYAALTSVAGTNTITATGPVNYTLAAGQTILYGIAANTNTGATTLAVSGGTAKNVFAGNAACVGGEIRANTPFMVYYDGTQYQLIGQARQPTRQVLTSGTAATYTTPTGATRINVRMVGGGGSGAQATAGSGNAGTNTTFGGSLTAGGGSGGGTNGSTGGTGGSATGGDINIVGSQGQAGTNSGATAQSGGGGGSSVFGGGAPTTQSNVAGGGAVANTGSGGSGSGNTGAGATGGGGGAGGYVEKLIIAPAATYTYTVGAGGAAVGANSGGGAAGIIIVDEYYN